ncbi:Histone deacetylase complex subunit SAP18 [Vitis vinifera]|uniref:Histone deacetylase complex subunit SAP18 n=1 Tax=Vitis vinifera TaxID=29760 RepID=A0A438E0I0_VITVI|nr:Histone deacetylase complex subunit SAP18 [Vitis vinifera]
MTFLWGRSRRKLEGSFPHVCFRPYGRKGIKGHLKMQNCNLLGWIGCHHSKEDFAVRGKEPKDEVQIYTWKDATLRELTDLVKEVAPAARRRDAILSFAFVYPDTNGRFVLREVGKTFSYGNGKRLDDGKALAELGFQIGDYLDVAIL